MAPASVALIARTGGPHTGAYVSTLPLMERVGRVHLCDLEGQAFGVAGGAAAAPAAKRQAYGDRLAGTSADVASCLAAGPYALVVVSLDNREAPGVIRQVLEAGCNVFSEKLGARTAAEWEPILALAERRGLHLGMAYLNRTRPSVVEARRLVAMGALGKLYGFYVQSVATQAQLRDPMRSWTFDPERAGGGYLAWLGCHYLDLLRYVTGREVASISAAAGRVGYEGLRVEDAVALAMTLDDGAVGSASFGYYLDAEPRFGGKQSQLLLWGELGWVRLQPGEDDAVPLEYYSRHPAFAAAPHRTVSFDHRQVPGAYGSAWGLEFMNQFLAACLGEGEPPVAGRDALAVLRIIDAAYASVRGRAIVEVER